MKKLVVAATPMEIQLLAAQYKVELSSQAGSSTRAEDTFFLICGIGQAICAAHLSRFLADNSIDLVLNVGLCGAFTQSNLKIGEVVLVSSEIFSDLGIEFEDRNSDLFSLGLLDASRDPFVDGTLRAVTPSWLAVEGCRRVSSVTVNRILGSIKSIEDVVSRYEPEVVNMEGASVLYTCGIFNRPCVIIRAVSDFVGPREKREWNAAEAIKNLNVVVCNVLKEISQ